MSKYIPAPDDNFSEPLTERELQILNLLADGLSDPEIAESLHLSLKTVKWYNFTQIYSKLGVNNRHDAVTRAKELGLLEYLEPEPIRHNLPAQTTAFIGREQELSDLYHLLNIENMRLVTILASGGMGKTRLALELAQRQLRHYADGIFFVPLAPLASPEHIAMAIADALKLHLQGEEGVSEQVQQYLSDKQLLLILDNFEHLLEASTLVHELLEAAAHLKILVTSREKLGLSGEKIYTIAGMVFPDWETPEDALEYDAVKLFLQAAELVSSDFQLDADKLKFLARICRLSEGMPLAIKLAAAWVDVLSLEEIAHEIQQSIDFLAAQIRDMPRRQWSIRAVFEPTWKRLTTEEQAVFMKFAVFRGGCSRDAAQAITGATLRQLQLFISKSLLSRTSTGRYEIHELLRQYAEEQLLESDESEASYDTHAQYFANFLDSRESDLKGHRQKELLSEIEADFENVRSAWNRAVEQRDDSILDKMLESLCWYCLPSLHLIEGEALFEEACAAFVDNDRQTQIWVKLLSRLFFIQIVQYGNLLHRSKIDWELEQCLQLAQSTHNNREIAICNFFCGDLAMQRQQFELALEHLQQSLAGFQSIEDRFYIGWSLFHIANYMASTGNMEKAMEYNRRGLLIRREIGDTFGIVMSLVNFGSNLLRMGYLTEAEEYYQQALALRRTLTGLGLLGKIAFLRGDIERARELSESGMQIFEQNRYPLLKLYALTTLGAIACIEEDYLLARQLCSEAQLIKASLRNQFNSVWLSSLVACGDGDIKAALEALRDSLSFTYRERARGLITWCLPIAVVIEAHRRNTAQAVQILSLTYNHPNSETGWLEKWPLMSSLQQDLEAEIGSEAYHQAWEEGKNLDLMMLVEALLEDYAKIGD